MFFLIYHMFCTVFHLKNIFSINIRLPKAIEVNENQNSIFLNVKCQMRGFPGLFQAEVGEGFSEF